MLPHVTDHAILRFLEREHGIPVEAVRRLLALRAATGEMNGTIPLTKRTKLVLQNGVVITTLRAHWQTRGARS